MDPARRSGKLCARGTRINVHDVPEYLAGGMSRYEILRDFAELQADDIAAAPESAHVSAAGLGDATDPEIWEHARTNGLAICSKDSDFRQMSFA